MFNSIRTITAAFMVFTVPMLYAQSSLDSLIANSGIGSYKSFAKAYKKNPEIKQYAKRYNLLFMALIDSSYKEPIFKYNPQIKLYYDSLTTYKSGVNQSFVVPIKRASKQKWNGDFWINPHRASKIKKQLYPKTCRYLKAEYPSSVIYTDSSAIIQLCNTDKTDYAIYKAKLVNIARNQNNIKITPLTNQIDFSSTKELYQKHRSNYYGFGIRLNAGQSIITDGYGDIVVSSELYEDIRYYDARLCYEIGVNYALPLNRSYNVWIQPNILYSHFSAVDVTEGNPKTEINLNYIKIPLLFIANVRGAGYNYFDFIFGFYVAKGIGGSFEWQQNGTKNSVNAFDFQNDSRGLNSFDIGNVCGIAIPVKRLRFNAMINFSHKNMAEKSFIPNSNSGINPWMLCASYTFGVEYNFGFSNR